MADLLDKAKVFVAEKVGTVKTPEATINDVDLKNVSREGIECLAKVNVNNPYITPIPICEIDYILKSDTRFVFQSISKSNDYGSN